MKRMIPNEPMMALVKDAISRGQKATLKVAGTSMMPFFKDAITEVTLVPIDSLKQLDVILFQIQDKYYLHRIIKIDHHRITAQGDHLFSKEEINDVDIIAKVESFMNHGMVTMSRHGDYLMKVRLWRLIKPLILRLRRTK